MWNTFKVYGNIAQYFDGGNKITLLIITNRKYKDKETGEIKEIARPNMLTILNPKLMKFIRDNVGNIGSIIAKGELFDKSYTKDDQTFYNTNRIVHEFQVTKWKNAKAIPQETPDIEDEEIS